MHRTVSIRPIGLISAVLIAAALPATAHAAPFAFSPFSTVALSSGQARFAVGDINGDHHADIVTGSSATPLVRLGDRLGGFGTEYTIGAGLTPFDVALADLDGDGDLDLLQANYITDGISIRLGNGDGTFATPATDAGATDA
jgi:hypothetical protein